VITGNTDWAGVLAAPLEPPDGAGSYWEGVSHADFLVSLKAAFKAVKWVAGKEVYALRKDGTEMSASVEIRGHRQSIPRGHSLCVGVLNSNTRRFRPRLYLGLDSDRDDSSYVFEEFVMGKRVRGRPFADDLAVAVSVMKEFVPTITDAWDRLCRHPVGTEEANALFMRAGERKLLPYSAVGLAYETYRDRSRGQTLKDIVWAFSHAARLRVPPTKQLRVLYGFTEGVVNEHRKLAAA
jgi:hypothetical protein